jgi:hypothetical protein
MTAPELGNVCASQYIETRLEQPRQAGQVDSGKVGSDVGRIATKNCHACTGNNPKANVASGYGRDAHNTTCYFEPSPDKMGNLTVFCFEGLSPSHKRD